MARPGFVKRLGDLRKRLKARLYSELGALLQGDLGADKADLALDLFCRLGDLERQDGNGAVERLLAGLPNGAAIQIRQELGRLLDEEGIA
ncbi:MAG TPA: hypothetical protein VKD72_06270 [Gemmataceae bacterium]|nr:hypothetical protein [Gemmataceae bacterium]